MTDLLSLAVALICLGAIYSKHIPTGVLGSAGLALIGMAALVAVDNSSFANVQRLEGIVIALLVGFLMLVVHLTLMVWRGSTGKTTRRRRTTDWQAFDAEDTRPMERA
jgi:cell shape-determining protein MreD